MIDFEPNEEQQLIVETVRQFAANEVRSLARDCDESGKIPDSLLAQAHELGLTANALPEAHGGGGERSALTQALIAEELAWGDLSLAVALLSPTLLAFPVADLGSEAQKSELLGQFAGAHFVPGSIALVEPRYDFDPFKPHCRARLDGDSYVLSGEKCFVPWQDGGATTLVTASDEAGAAAFLVPRNATGLEIEREANMGLRGIPTVELELRDVRIPASSRLGEGSESGVRSIIHRGRVGLSAMAVGVARAAFEIARDYAKQREAFGVPIATKQAIAFKLADMAIEIDGARLLAWEAAWRLDQGADVTREATLAYQRASQVALTVADGAVQVLGGHGYIRDYLPEMHLRNARGFANFEALTLV